MELDQTLVVDSWKEIEAIENETKLLLETVPNTQKKKESRQHESKNQKKKEKEKLKSAANDNVPALGLKTTLGKATVEIFDDASPDVTPRNDDDNLNQLLNKRPKDYYGEAPYRNLTFTVEQRRISKGFDKYLSATFISPEEIEKERNRLLKIEDESRQKALALRTERLERSEYLKEDRAALKIQRTFRGHIGRKRFSLTYQIKKILKTDDANDWVEVQDKETGDTWYYNKITNESQWNMPDILLLSQHSTASLPSVGSKHSKMKPATGSMTMSTKSIFNKQNKTIEVSMSLPTLEAMKTTQIPALHSIPSSPNQVLTSKKAVLSKSLDQQQFLKQAQKDVDNELGINKLSKRESLTAPDGSFKPLLRNVVLDALLDTRFDSVATVLADTRWFEKNEEVLPNLTLRKESEKATIVESRLDVHRPPLVSILTFNKKNKVKKPSAIRLSEEENDEQPVLPPNDNGVAVSAADLTLNHIEHTGFEDPVSQQMMCFGCWSAGLHKKCSLHETGAKIKASETMLLCRNWDIDVMRRRYRSEEIQELFMKRESSLRYNAKYHRFYTVIEEKHPIYRMTSQLLERFNARMTLFARIKFWMLSLAEEYRQGKVHPSTKELAKFMRIKRGLYHLKKIERFTSLSRPFLPLAPITGYSWPERTNSVQYLYKYLDKVLKEEVDIIKIEPIPVPKKLYEPKEYHVPLPQTIPLLPYRQGESAITERVLPANNFINDINPAAWLEKLSSSFVKEKIDFALIQIKASTPLSTIDLKIRTKKPTPSTLKYASLGTKPVPGNLAVGGLPLEMLIYLVVSTYFPPQYGNFTVMDKSMVSPGVSPEITIAFESILMPPTVQPYIERPLEHPLTYRRPPTITLNSNVTPDNKHFYGINRPEQTGEQESHGFRTTTWAPMLLTATTIDPHRFVPGQEVVSLNVPKSNTSNTTHADYSYPFCEPSTRDNSTLDFYHLLLTGVVSLSCPQIFTALSVQEPGDFQKAYRLDLPMGHIVIAVYRSWGFTQQDTIQEFKTDDGISYWYHRKTGQTFWERPLYDDEDKSPLEGGTLLDTDHPEEPTMMTKGNEGAGRRYLQGEFRKNMLMHIETKKDAVNRRKAAASTVKNARQRGVLAEPVGLASMINNPGNQSIEIMGSNANLSKIDFNHSQEAMTMSYDGRPPGTILPGSGRGNDALIATGAPFTPLPANFGSSSVEDGSWLPPAHHQGQQQLPINQFPPPSQPLQSSITPNFYQQNVTNNAYQQPPQQGGIYQMNSFAADSNFMPSHFMTNSRMQGTGGPTPRLTPSKPLMSGVGIGGVQGGFDPNVINALSQSLGQLFTNMMSLDKTNPQDMIQLGMGMGLALMQTGAVQNLTQSQMNNSTSQQQNQHYIYHSDSENNSQQDYNHPTQSGMIIPGGIAEEFSASLHEQPSHTFQHPHQQQQQQPQSHQFYPSQSQPSGFYGGEPIGQPNPTMDLATDKQLPHYEEMQQKIDAAKRFETPLNTMEIARGLKINPDPGITPDEMPPKVLTLEKHSNAEEEVRDGKAIPLLAYPELSTALPTGAPPAAYQMKSPAGLGTSFVSKEDEESQLRVPGTHLRKTVLPLPVGFWDAITAKHVAKQAVDYLPQVPNLPQSRTIGRVKPRSAAADWLMISFDPWSAGKNPLGTEYVPSLMAKADKLLGTGGGQQAIETMESLRQTTVADAYVNVVDEEGIAQQKAEVSKAQVMAEEFKKLCSLCRHSKFQEAEQLINQPDWAVPIDYQDDLGNALVHVAAQNGSKKLIKLCLRRGCDLNIQNLNGQTALHFAFGYGYSDVGDYLVEKGADDSIRNKDGLTCYEGLGARELALL